MLSVLLIPLVLIGFPLQVGQEAVADGHLADILIAILSLVCFVVVLLILVVMILYVKRRARGFGLVCPRCDSTLIMPHLKSIAIAAGRCGRCGLRLFPEDEP
jgi:hypothetical protein